MHMPWVFDDGGRAAAGFTGHAGDCVARSIAIAAEKSYQEVYDALAAGTAAERRSKYNSKRAGVRSAARGISTTRKWFKDYMKSLGFVWTATMGIGTGTRVHLAAGELPEGRLIVKVSKHYTAVIDGVVHDTHDPQREPETIFDNKGVEKMIGGRCVYGYWCKTCSRCSGEGCSPQGVLANGPCISLGPVGVTW